MGAAVSLKGRGSVRRVCCNGTALGAHPVLHPCRSTHPCDFRGKLVNIQRTATAAQIKKAYRKEAIKWHPDKNPTGKKLAEEKFREVAEAYEAFTDCGHIPNY